MIQTKNNHDTRLRKIELLLDSFSELPPMLSAENLYDQSTAEGVARTYNAKLYFKLMLQKQPNLLIIGEAPGYQGTRRTGVPFASEYITDGRMPEASLFAQKSGFGRVFQEARTYREPTSTVMWRTISRYNRLPLLWAVFPHHPHQPGNPESNRTPTRGEILQAKPILTEFLDIFQVDQIIALGNIAKTTLDALEIDTIKVRHPSRGGATIFAGQLDDIVRTCVAQ